MKKILLALAIGALAAAAYAGPSPSPSPSASPSPSPGMGRHMDDQKHEMEMKEYLQLTDAQVAAMRTENQRFRKQVMDARDAHRAAVKKILTAEQLQKLEARMKERRAEHEMDEDRDEDHEHGKDMGKGHDKH